MLFPGDKRTRYGVSYLTWSFALLFLFVYLRDSKELDMRDDYSLKFAYILLAYIRWVLVAIGLFVAFRWLCWVKLALPWDESVWATWLPMGIGFLLPFIVLRRRIKVLKRVKRTRDWKDFLRMVMMITTFFTLFCVHEYEKRRTPFVTVEDVNGVTNSRDELYYVVNHFTLDKSGWKAGVSYTPLDRKSDNLRYTIDCYLVFPFAQGEMKYWYALEFHSPESYSGNDNLDSLHVAFTERCLNNISNMDLEGGHRFEKILGSNDLRFYQAAIELAIDKERAGQAVVLKPMPPGAEPEGGLRLVLIVVALVMGVAVMSLTLAAIPLDEQAYDRQKKQIAAPTA